MQIGNLSLENNVFLAPMAGVTDLPFRTLCKEMGCAMVYSEMVSAKGFFYDSINTKKLLETQDGDKPLAVQIFGSSPEIMANMAANLPNADLIDINMGCPAPKIVRNGEGSALMQNIGLIERIVKAVSSATEKSVTVKIRKGFGGVANAVDVAKAAEASGAAAITVHGRMREEYYSGTADWDIIKKVKASVKIPVIGNGDVVCPQSAKKLLEHTGCDAIMVGRAAQGNPWIFMRIVHYLQTGELLPPPTNTERIEMALRHAQMLISHKGEFIAIREMRKHIGWYIKGLPGAAALRANINSANTFGEMSALIETLCK